jgi:hypothetical protein
MSQTQRRPSSESAHQSSFESTPWAAREVEVEEPRETSQEKPLLLAQDEHVVDAALDADAIRRSR